MDLLYQKSLVNKKCFQFYESHTTKKVFKVWKKYFSYKKSSLE
jgi:hypothetical protein